MDGAHHNSRGAEIVSPVRGMAAARHRFDSAGRGWIADNCAGGSHFERVTFCGVEIGHAGCRDGGGSAKIGGGSLKIADSFVLIVYFSELRMFL